MATRKPVAEAGALPTRQQWADYVAANAAVNPSFVPLNQLCIEDLDEWETAKDQLARLKSTEALLRDRVVKFFFPQAEEGTNNAKLPDGTKIVAVQPVTRKVDQVALDHMRKLLVKDMRSHLENLKIDTQAWPDEMPVVEALQLGDSLIKWVPELAIAEYRTLTSEQLAIFDSVLEVKPGSPQVKIEHPKV
jgi:hypothetical protein